MTRRAENEQEQRGATPASPAAAPPGQRASTDRPGVKELPLAAFMMENPGVVAVGKAGS